MLNTGVIFVIVLQFVVITILWGQLNLIRGRMDTIKPMINLLKYLTETAEKEKEQADAEGTMEKDSLGD